MATWRRVSHVEQQ